MFMSIDKKVIKARKHNKLVQRQEDFNEMWSPDKFYQKILEAGVPKLLADVHTPQYETLYKTIQRYFKIGKEMYEAKKKK